MRAKPTIDLTRRKQPITVDQVLALQRRRFQKTGSLSRLRLRPDQREQFYALLHIETAGSGVTYPVVWNGMEIVVPGEKS